MSEKYDPLKGIRKTQATLITEAVGYSVAGKIASLDTTGVANTAFATGSSLAGVPSLMSGAKNVMDSVNSLYPKKKK